MLFRSILNKNSITFVFQFDAARRVADRSFVWFQGLNGLDVIAENGRLLTGGGSSVCKEEIFKAYLQLARADKRILKYSRAKKQAGHYQLMKKLLYKKVYTCVISESCVLYLYFSGRLRRTANGSRERATKQTSSGWS